MDRIETNEKIITLRRLIEDDVYLHQGDRVNEVAIKDLIEAINQDLIVDYTTQRTFISNILFIYDKYANHIFSTLYDTFLKRIDKLKSIHIQKLDLSFWNDEFNFDEVFISFKPFFEKHLSTGKNIRLSEEASLKIDSETGGTYIRFIHRHIAQQSIGSILEEDDVNAALMLLWMARSISIAIDRKEFFYFLINLFFDGLHFNQDFQLARDVVEECLICSHKDNLPEYGYFLSFKVFSSTSDSVTALHYANISLQTYIQNNNILDYSLKSFYWEAIKFSRNVNLAPFAIEIFENRPTNIEYSSYDQNKFHHAYFSSLLLVQLKELPILVLDYVDKNKEIIISGGQHEALPWLVLLFNVKSNYTHFDYDENLLNLYVELFKRMVDKENYQKVYNILFGTVEELTKDLKDCLIKLSRTRNKSDLVTDNKIATKVANKLISESFKGKNVDGYLLSMIVQSDFSIVFKDKDALQYQPISESFIDKKFEDEYYTPKLLRKFIEKLEDASILWLGTDNHKILPLFYNGNNFQFINEKDRNLIDASNFYTTNIKLLPHVSNKPTGLIREKFQEDYKEEEEEIRNKVSILDLPIDLKNTLLVIKGIELSNFPHNLITTKGSFIINNFPLSNIMSLEWLYENYDTSLNVKFSKSIWIPTDSQDFAINLMYSKMEDALLEYEVTQFCSIIPDNPLNADLNILVAHGGEKINTFPAFYLHNDTTTFAIKKIDHIVESGKILVLFVCHSGSERTDLFKNQIATTIKEFLLAGYQSVIAPFWALSIDIPPIWLPEFLKNLSSGKDVGSSFHSANKKVSEIYNTPKAYACLHLYGNPFLKSKSC